MNKRNAVFVSAELHERLRYAAVDLKTTVKQVVEWGMDAWLKELGEPDREKIRKEAVK